MTSVRPGHERRRELRGAVQRLIEDLGPSVGTIADRLGDLGVKGRPGDEERCVLSSYLGLVVGADPAVASVAVRPHAIHVRTRRTRPAVRVPLSVEAQAFIAAFDAGLFPGLIVDGRAAAPSATPTSASTASPA
jgi:hypothetical protein